MSSTTVLRNFDKEVPSAGLLSSGTSETQGTDSRTEEETCIRREQSAHFQGMDDAEELSVSLKPASAHDGVDKATMEEEEEVLKSQEDGLKSDFQDLKAQIEENELIHGIPSKGMSSIYIPRDPEHFRRQRKLILQRTLQVAGPRQITLQAEEMTLEQNTCSKGEFNSRTIPSLVAQYFLDRMSEIVIAKHLLLLRWKRFCSDTSKVEQVYQDYLNLLEFLTQEYLDASSRAHRLTSASESLLARNDNCLEDIEYEDYLIYWKHMIVKLQSQTYFKQIIALLKWFPYGHREGFKQDLSVNHFIDFKFYDYFAIEF
ncbi:unnamed protein product [Dibothriocephalus latus]|uniref:DUF4549 domain-containing protein n=1 Tax=Dibothriocephalus latus TaxID=60516 RepID=A0A3P7KZK0_DIBLA|nr:unnamed protein product [Dibothriocephalus latus]